MFADAKPILSALLQPPASLILLVVAALLWRRPPGGLRLAALAAAAGLWLMSCSGTALWLQAHALQPPAPLGAEALDRLRASEAEHGRTAIVVLGAGRHRDPPEYGSPDLTDNAWARLRHGAWLARRSGWPVAYSGGIGWAQAGGASEADTARQQAAEVLGLPLRWLEDRSRDTAENARLTTALLAADGVRRIVLVTQASHMPRAVRLFEAAGASAGVSVIPAATGYVQADDRSVLAWLPSAHGFRSVHAQLHELLGLAAMALQPGR